MDGENDPGNNGTDSGTPPPPPPTGTPQTFTQDQLTQIAAREKDQGARAARKALLEDLGFKSQDEIKSFVTKARETELAAMSEAERIKAEAEAVKAAAEAERNAAARERHTTAVERALIAAGAPLAKTDRLARLVEAEQGADAEAIKAAVEQVKTEFPEMFGTPASPRTSSEPAGGGPPPARTNGTTPWESGKAEAQKRIEAAKRAQGQTP